MVRISVDDVSLRSVKMVKFRILLQNEHRLRTDFGIEKKQYKIPMGNSSTWLHGRNLQLGHQE